MDKKRKPKGVVLRVPGVGQLHIKELWLDFNGTLAKDGKLLPGVAERLKRLSKTLDIFVLTADTFGNARKALRRLPLKTQVIGTGNDKKRFIQARSGTAAIGNGRNDVEMVQDALIGVAVLGPEGCSGELLKRAAIVVKDINDGLDLFLNPQRLVATLRS